MKLIYYAGHSNFGDLLNVTLSRKVFGDIFDDDKSNRFLFIGTMIGRSPPPGTREIIVGAGAGYKGHCTLERREIFCVRGPLTCKMLGLEDRYAAIDPAILCSRFYFPDRLLAKRTQVTFIPHFSTDMAAGGVFRRACEELGLTYVSPLDRVETVIDCISKSRHVITEALHGAIVAEAYGIPWIPVITASHVMQAKWDDFCRTIGLDYQPVEMHLNVAFNGAPQLTSYLKYASYRLGIGKDRYKYLALRNPKGDETKRLVAKLRSVLQEGHFITGKVSIKSRSIERLDNAIERFKEVYCR
jgi:succinoglycan biosynthesis protein ExoV